MNEDIEYLIRQAIPKDLLLDLEDRIKAEAEKAYKMIRDKAGLGTKDARWVEGMARHKMSENGFKEVCEIHGGQPLENGTIPNTNLKIFQPYMRFNINGQGIILGLAMMPKQGKMPSKNKSRLAGVSLNFNLQASFDFSGIEPKIGDIFALFLVCRDKDRAGEIIEIAISIIDSKYSSFLFYKPLNKFLIDYPNNTSNPQEALQSSQINKQPSLKLKNNIKPFRPPESPDDDHKNKDTKK